ncbi:MAG: hypothetical protein Q9174_005314 [Haloplaca sp. 1 TL-2023]
MIKMVSRPQEQDDDWIDWMSIIRNPITLPYDDNDDEPYAHAPEERESLVPLFLDDTQALRDNTVPTPHSAPNANHSPPTETTDKELNLVAEASWIRTHRGLRVRSSKGRLSEREKQEKRVYIQESVDDLRKESGFLVEMGEKARERRAGGLDPLRGCF